jgi:hypothetical protein
VLVRGVVEQSTHLPDSHPDGVNGPCLLASASHVLCHRPDRLILDVHRSAGKLNVVHILIRSSQNKVRSNLGKKNVRSI